MSDPQAPETSLPETNAAQDAAGAAPAYPGPRALESVLLHHRSHARRRLFEFLATLEREDFVRPVPCLAGESIRDRLVHVVDTERFWMSLLQSRPADPLRPEDCPNVESILNASIEATDRTLSILRTADAGWFVRRDLFGIPGGNRPPERLIPSLVVLHVLTHEFHHKGQICAAARTLGYEPPDLDLI